MMSQDIRHSGLLECIHQHGHLASGVAERIADTPRGDPLRERICNTCRSCLRAPLDRLSHGTHLAPAVPDASLPRSRAARPDAPRRQRRAIFWAPRPDGGRRLLRVVASQPDAAVCWWPDTSTALIRRFASCLGGMLWRNEDDDVAARRGMVSVVRVGEDVAGG